MFQLNILAILFITNSFLSVISDTDHSSGSRLASCPPIKLLHGRIKYRNKMTQAKFLCNRSYILAGERFAICRRGVWDNGRPVCVKTTCPKVNPPHNAILYPAYSGGVLNFYCKPGYEIRGPTSSYCDGVRWNTSLPACLLTNTLPALSCDFESSDLCGWSQDMNHNFDWKRENFETARGHIETGPKYDHDHHDNGTGGFGYYMYIESASRRENDSARLISPIYAKNENGFCFSFWYHMYGIGIGQLRIYVKKESDSYDLKRAMPQFIRRGNQGDAWTKGSFYIEEIDEDFQIIIEGIRGSQIESDIAVDDVKMSDYCEDSFSSSTTDASTDLIQIFESCQDRCGQNISNYFILNSSLINCECSDDCIENNSCCPDYIAFCVLDSSTDSYTDDTEEPSSTTEPTKTPPKPTVIPISVTTKPEIITTVSAIPTTTILIPKTTQKIETTTRATHAPTKPTRNYPITKPVSPQTKSVNPKPTTTIEKATTLKPSTQKITTAQTTAKATQTPKTTTQKPIKPTEKPTQNSIKNKIPNPGKTIAKIAKNENNSEKVQIVNVTSKPLVKPRIIGPRVKPTTAPVEDTTDAVQTPQIETDYERSSTAQTIDPFAQMSLRHAESKDVGAQHSKFNLILGVVCTVVSVMLFTTLGVVLRRKFGLGCRGFKQQRYSESMSDVRFLAGDEALDFTWRQPDN